MLLVGQLTSSAAFAQAEAAPESYEPPPNLSMSPDPTTTVPDPRPVAQGGLWSLTVNGRLAIALATPTSLPRVGFGVGGTIGRMLVTRGPLRFGLEFAFSYDRFQHNADSQAPLAISQSTESLGQASFSFDLRLEALLGRGFARPWIAIGPGLSIGDYSGAVSDDGTTLEPARSAVVAALRVSGGVAFRVWRMLELGPHIELLATFGGPHVTNGQTVLSPGNLDVGLDLGFRL